MRKIKFKRKSKKSILISTRFIAFFIIIVLLGLSSTYALFSDTLTITGTVTGELEYTYYFKKPDDWSNTMYAYIWNENPFSEYSGWYGENMTWDNKQNAYKVTFPGSTPHDHIIFNDNGGRS